MALDHINLYLLEDTDGWYVIDTGMKGNDKQRYWQQIFDEALQGKPVKGVIVTHMHPDHIGQSGWICDKFNVPLYMSRGEFFGAHTLNSLPAGLSWTAEQYMRRNGASEERIENSRSSKFRMSDMVEPLPLAYERLQADDVLTINSNKWTIIIGEGHSPEHVSLYCETLGILISGDQMIPKISSNVSVMPMQPNANPLADWLRTLKPFFDLPADTLVVPAHNTPFY